MMRFNRLALIEACKAAEAETERVHRAAVERDERNREQHLHEWLDVHEDQWRAFADRIRTHLDSGRPIVQGDLPRANDRYGNIAVYTAPRRDAPETYTPPADVLSLRATLEAITDEQVSTSGLKDLGFSQRTMGRITGFLRPASQ